MTSKTVPAGLEAADPLRWGGAGGDRHSVRSCSLDAKTSRTNMRDSNPASHGRRLSDPLVYGESQLGGARRRFSATGGPAAPGRLHRSCRSRLWRDRPSSGHAHYAGTARLAAPFMRLRPRHPPPGSPRPYRAVETAPRPARAAIPWPNSAGGDRPGLETPTAARGRHPGFGETDDQPTRSRRRRPHEDLRRYRCDLNCGR